jgi:hypothetical protein
MTLPQNVWGNAKVGLDRITVQSTDDNLLSDLFSTVRVVLRFLSVFCRLTVG